MKNIKLKLILFLIWIFGCLAYTLIQELKEENISLKFYSNQIMQISNFYWCILIAVFILNVILMIGLEKKLNIKFILKSFSLIAICTIPICYLLPVIIFHKYTTDIIATIPIILFIPEIMHLIRKIKTYKNKNLKSANDTSVI